MGWFIFLLLTSIIASITGQTVTNENDESISVEEFEAQLQDEALKVLVQHSDEMSRISKPPSFDMPQNFMRSFIPGTGVGNREELVIESIKKISVYHNSKYSQWHYKRFNNTDYVLAVEKRNVVLNKFDSSTQDSFTFLDKGQILHKPEAWSSVIDAALFIRSIKRSVVLYVAVLTEEARTSFVTIYEVIGGTGVPVSLIDLGISPSTGPFEAKKIAFVESQLGSSLVVLINSPYEARVIPQQKGSSELNHYIEVQYPEAVDLVTFTVLGHGYIAVANSTSCDIYKFNKYTHSILLFDSITSRADLTDLEYFRLGFHHYLAVSGRTEQYLYVWKSGEFGLTQTFGRFNISQIHSSMLPTCRDDVILFLIGDAQTYIYVYDGKNEEFILYNGAIPSNFVISPNSIASFAYKNKVKIIFQNFDNLEAYVIETSLKKLPNPFLVAGESVTDYMKNVQQKVEDQAKQVQNIKDVLKKAVRTTGDQHITAFQKFDNLRTNKEAAINLEKTLHVVWNNTDLTLEQYKIGTENLEKSVAELEKLIEEIERIIPDVVRLDQDAEITGSKTFWGDVTGSSIQAYAVNLETVAGINVPQLQNEIYRLDKQQQIKGTLSFEETLTIFGNLEVEETVNDVDISRDVMTTNTKQTSSANMIFKEKVVVEGDLNLSGKLEGIDISEEVITLNGNHIITGKKSFQNGIVAVNVNTILLDGININELYEQALTKSGDQEITGTKTFNGGIVTNDIILNGLLNGNNVVELAESIVRIDQPAIITGNKTFLEDVHIESTLTVKGRVNGLRIPEDLFLTDVRQNVTGTKNFAGTVTAYNVIVEGTVDGLKIPDDIVTLSKDEEIFSNLFFAEGIHVEDDITVHGLVDGVDVKDLVRQAMKVNESHTFEEAIFLGPVTITGRLSVDGTINGINLEDIVKDIVFKDDENIVIKSKKFFNKMKAETVNLEKMINGYNISVDFMKVDGDQNIKGTKLFKQPVTFKSLNIKDGMMGHLNVTQLFEHRLTLEIEDEVDKNVEFVDHVIVEGNLGVHGTIGGLRIPEDIVLKNSVMPIANKIFANKVVTDNLIVNGNAVISGSFGGVDLKKFYNDRVSLSSEQDIHGDVWIGNSTAGTIELSGLIDGIDIIEFASNVMSKTKDQVVWAEKIFRGEIIADGPITTEEGINRVNLADMNRRAFKLHSHNIVNELLEFEAVVVNDIKVSGLINGLNFTHLAEDGLRKRANLQRVTGINTFEAGFEVNGNIEAETVNDLYLPIDILLKSPPQNITGQFTIQNLNVDGNVHVEGLVNGLDLSKIAPHIVRTDQESIIESDVIFLKPIHVSENVEVTGNVNGIDLKQIFDNIVLKKGEQVIKGNKIIRGNVTIEGDIDVDYVNGFNWKAFLADVVHTDKPQVIRSLKTFLMDTEVTNLFAKKATATLVNGKILENFLNEVVFIDVPANITGRKEFKGDVEITGNLNAELINELRLRTDVITLACNNDDPQKITGEKTFEKLTVYEDINVEGKVNSYNLLELYKDTLLTEGDQHVFGMKHLNFAIFLGNVSPKTVNGMELQKDLVTLNTDQEIETSLVFNGDIVVENNLWVQGLINGVNVTQLADEAVYLDNDETIVGSYHFKSAEVTSNVDVEGLVNGIDLPLLDKNVDAFWEDITQSLQTMDKHSLDSCELANDLQNVLSKSYYILDGFDILKGFNYPASFLQIESPQEIALINLNDNSSKAIAISHIWNSSTNNFLATRYEPTSIAKTLIKNIGGFEVHINIGILETDSSVTLDGSSLAIPGGFKDAAVLVKDHTEIVLAILFPSKGICETFRMSSLPSTSNLHVESYDKINVGKEATSLALYEIGNVIYLAVSRVYDYPKTGGYSKIYTRMSDGWQRFQNIPGFASSYVKHFFYHGFHYLAFSNIAPVHETREPKSIQIFRNSGSNHQWFSLFQKVPFDHSKGLEVFEFGDLSELYLTTWNETRIQIYRLEGESGLKLSFTLHGKCIQDVKPLKMDGNIYLAVGQQNLKSGHLVTSVLYKGLTKGVRYTPHNFKNC